MLAQPSYAAHFGDRRFVIIDELHSFAGNKRGADLTISLERLERLRQDERSLCRIGLSATAAPVGELRRFLLAPPEDARSPRRVMRKRQSWRSSRRSGEILIHPLVIRGVRLYAELADLIRRQQSVLVFTNVRSAAEQIGLRLKELMPELADQIETHDASLDRSVRLEVEDRLKNGDLRAVVCSTSLELGVDIGAVDLVVMVATPKGVSRAIQRIGRSGYFSHRTSHGVLVATNVNDLVEATVTARLVRERALDPIRIPEKPFDVIAQQVVGMVSNGPIVADEIFRLVRRAYPFRERTGRARPDFDLPRRRREIAGA